MKVIETVEQFYDETQKMARELEHMQELLETFLITSAACKATMLTDDEKPPVEIIAYCPNCKHLLDEDEIIGGYPEYPDEIDTYCPVCLHNFPVTAVIHVNPESLRYVQLGEIQTINQLKSWLSERSFATDSWIPEFLQQDRPALFYNVLYYANAEPGTTCGDLVDDFIHKYGPKRYY